MTATAEKTILDFEDVSELTPELLTICLDNFLPDSFEKTATEVTELYFNNSDHGFSHSQDVWRRCQEIIEQSPLIWRMANAQSGSEESSLTVLILASIFHDLARFCDADFATHERQGAVMARSIVHDNGSYSVISLSHSLYSCIINHDYFCELVNGCLMPSATMCPLSEIFRLADKTSNSPAGEIRRYHATGRRVAPESPIYDPMVSDEVRFNLSGNIANRADELTWFLALFAVQSTDFIYGDTRDAYAYWARGKEGALETIADLCREAEYLNGQTPVDPAEAKQVVRRFCRQNNLILIA